MKIKLVQRRGCFVRQLSSVKLCLGTVPTRLSRMSLCDQNRKHDFYFLLLFLYNFSYYVRVRLLWQAEQLYESRPELSKRLLALDCRAPVEKAPDINNTNVDLNSFFRNLVDCQVWHDYQVNDIQPMSFLVPFGQYLRLVLYCFDYMKILRTKFRVRLVSIRCLNVDLGLPTKTIRWMRR